MIRRDELQGASARGDADPVRTVGRVRALACCAVLAAACAAGAPGRAADHAGRSLPFVVTSVTLQKQELEGLLAEYVRWGGETTHDQVVEALDRFAAGAAELADRASLAPGLLLEYRDLAGTDGDAGGASDPAAFERTARLLDRWRERSGTVLDRIGPDVARLEEGDAIVQNGIRRRLDSLGNDLLTLQLAAFERQDRMDEALERREALLASRVRSSYAALGIGLVLVLAMLGFLLHLKARTAGTLALGNERLRTKVEEARRLADQLEFNATHDQLTGLHNRHGFVAELQAAFTDTGAPHGIVFIDLDRFKAVNDTCGHGAGDALLTRIGALLSEQVRDLGVASRFGGDEFVLLLPRCNPGTLRGIAVAACHRLAGMDVRFDDRRFDIGGSVGAVLFDAATTAPDALMQVVDEASYASKREGGGRVTFRDLRERVASGTDADGTSNVLSFRKAS